MHTITADLTSGTRVEIRNGRHVWYADEPVDVGGVDGAPNPYEMLLGALAACTCITISYYAARKGLTLHSVSVRYTYDRVHAKDCEDCESADGGWLEHITSEIFIEGQFTDEQRARLREIALRCPVHKTLEKGVRFEESVTVG
jgi:putative redox protein